MAIELKQQLQMRQQLVMTPQLQQAIKLLQLSRMELIDSIREEMLENPMLIEEGMDESPEVAALSATSAERERGDESGAVAAETPAAQSSSSAEGPVSPAEPAPSPGDSPAEAGDKVAEIDWENYLDTYSHTNHGPTVRRAQDELPSLEQTLTKSPDLTDHLVWQLRMSDLTGEDESIAMMIIHNLDPNGYLADITTEEITAEIERAPELVETILAQLQCFDPVGVCARSLQESLLIQAAVHYPEDEDLQRVIQDHMPNLERKNYQVIAKDVELPLEEIIEIAKLVASMDPKPGRQYTGEDIHYITPDVHVLKVGDDYLTVLNEDGLPKLKVSDYYRQALSGSATSSARDYVQERLRSAVWIIRSIHQRQRTILKVTESIMKRQRDFLNHGITHLKPLILRDVADDIGMHESTVSRVTSNKYVHTPRGIFELKFFFNSGIKRYGADDIASEAVKDQIKQIVGGENPKKPHSDQQVVRILAQRNIHIARRTVAKYREMLGILPSSKRKRLF